MKKTESLSLPLAALQAFLAVSLTAVLVAFPPSFAAPVAIACAALLSILSLWRLRKELLFARLVRRVREGLETIAGGNYTLRVLTGGVPEIDGVILGVNRLAELLETVRAETIRSEAARKSILSDISHDIRTPLTSIIGYIGALRDDIASDGAERDAYIEILDAKSRALKNMIEDIFQLAKLDADEIPMKRETIDLAETVREILIDFLPEMGKAGMELATEIPETPVHLFADRMSVERIVRNLVQNAVKHGRDSRLIRVSVRVENSPGDIVSLLVADRGEGIRSEDLPFVFTRTFSRDRARNSSSGGSGLGLAIVQSLASKNGADVSARSEAGGETAFEVRFSGTGDLRKS